jgi:hypothetical protein
MQWLIQCTGLPDTHTLKLLEEVKKRDLPCVGIGNIPFTETLTGFETADPSLPSFFYGSTKLIEIVSSWKDYRPGTFYKKDWYDPRLWRRSDLLNLDQQEILVKDLREYWVKEPMFIKSVEPKLLTGMVIEPVKEDKDNWTIEQSELDGDVLLIMSPAQNIETECRFFVVDGKIVTGSTYRWLGARTIRRPIDAGLLGFAHKAIEGWMPSPTIVIDICRLKNGKYKVIEFNSVNSSGFYNCDVGAFVDAIEAKFGPLVQLDRTEVSGTSNLGSTPKGTSISLV